MGKANIALTLHISAPKLVLVDIMAEMFRDAIAFGAIVTIAATGFLFSFSLGSGGEGCQESGRAQKLAKLPARRPLSLAARRAAQKLLTGCQFHPRESRAGEKGNIGTLKIRGLSREIGRKSGHNRVKGSREREVGETTSREDAYPVTM